MSRPGHNRAASLLPILTMTLVGHTAAAAPGDPLPRAKPESVGMSSARLAAMGEFFSRETGRDAAAG